MVIGIVVLVDNSASEIESVDGDDVVVGGSDSNDSDGGSMTGKSLGTAYVGWDTSDGGMDVIDVSSQFSKMIGR